jgi:hypothetical protein
MKKTILFWLCVFTIVLCFPQAWGNKKDLESDEMLKELTPAEVIAKIKNDIDPSLLEKGELQSSLVKYKTKEGGEKGRVVGVILIDAPFAKVREIQGDWESQPQWVPAVKYYKTRYTFDELPEGIIRRRLMEGKLGIAFLTVTYSLDVKLHEDNKTEDWKLITKEECKAWNNKGVEIAPPYWGIKDIGGFGYLEPYEKDTEKTVYYYSPVIETTIPVPDIILRTAMKLTLPGYVEGFKKRAESGGTWTRKGYKK